MASDVPLAHVKVAEYSREREAGSAFHRTQQPLAPTPGQRLACAHRATHRDGTLAGSPEARPAPARSRFATGSEFILRSKAQQLVLIPLLFIQGSNLPFLTRNFLVIGKKK